MRALEGKARECPVCLEAFEDAVLTPCAHRLCRECLLASWRNPTSGFCPVCRRPSVGKILLQLRLEVDYRLMLRKLSMKDPLKSG